jgi:hypothetical protein
MTSRDPLVANNMPTATTPSITEQPHEPTRSADVPPSKAPMSAAPEATIAPLDVRLAGLLDDRRFQALFPRHDPTELRALVEEIQVLLDRCGLHVRLALAKKNWRHLRATRKRRRAAMIVGGRRGRPKGAANFSVQQYGLGLAMIWFDNTGRQPSRYLGANSRKGCYADFVQFVVDVAPPKFRGSLAGESPSIEYLLRTSLQAFRTARASDDEYRRRGLISEKDWLDTP